MPKGRGYLKMKASTKGSSLGSSNGYTMSKRVLRGPGGPKSVKGGSRSK